MTIHSTHRPAGASDVSADAGEPPQTMIQPAGNVDIEQSTQIVPAFDTGWLRERLAAAASIISHDAKRSIESIDVRIVSDAEMTELHRNHKGEARTTDVLSFDLSGGDNRSPIQTDIVVCADEAIRQAAALGHSVERELLLYSVHGLLHCAGFDDLTDEGFARMHAEEDRILKQIGVGTTFSAGQAGDNRSEDNPA